MTMGQYLPIVVLFVLALLFAVISRVASGLMAPRRPTAAKSAPYESGIVPSREPPARFPVRFYFVAMIFIVFDIEIVFLYPYAVIHQELGAYGLVELVAFSVIVFATFVYLIGNRGLDWGPVRRERRMGEPGDGVVSADRTTATTIRRVGLEGRPDRDTEAA
jgi:NADH-quinone oxidoreductase subunit A